MSLRFDEYLERTPYKLKNGAPIYRLRKAIRVRIDLSGGAGIPGHVVLDIDIPKGFLTDLASIPRLFWRWLPPDGPYWFEAIVHDWLCLTDRRRVADLVFGILLDFNPRVSWLDKRALYVGPRMYGSILPAKTIETLEQPLRTLQRQSLGQAA